MRLIFWFVPCFVFLVFMVCTTNGKQAYQTDFSPVLMQKEYLLEKQDWHQIENELRNHYGSILAFGDMMTGTTTVRPAEKTSIKNQTEKDVARILNNNPIQLSNYHLVNCVGCWFRSALENSNSRYYEVNQQGNYFFKNIFTLTIGDSGVTSVPQKPFLECLYFAGSCSTDVAEIVAYRSVVLEMFQNSITEKSRKGIQRILVDIARLEQNPQLQKKIGDLFQLANIKPVPSGKMSFYFILQCPVIQV